MTPDRVFITEVGPRDGLQNESVVVPLADIARVVTPLSHRPGPSCEFGQYLLAEVHHPVAKTAAPGQDLGPARRTDRVAAGCLKKGRSSIYQTIQARSLDDLVAKGGYGVRSLVIAYQKQNIRSCTDREDRAKTQQADPSKTDELHLRRPRSLSRTATNLSAIFF